MTVQTNATIIALYGNRKPAELVALIADVQGRMLDAVGGRFVPRPIPDVHLTVVGLERADVDVVGLSRYLSDELTAAPMTVRFGGTAEDDHRVDGRGRRLFDRALVVGAEKIVLIGWPIDADGQPTDRLDQIRRAASRFGARHRYFTTPRSRDPDAYSVVGDLLPGADPTRLARAARECRSALAQSRCLVPLSADDVRLADYLDTRLPAASTTSVALADVVSRP